MAAATAELEELEELEELDAFLPIPLSWGNLRKIDMDCSSSSKGASGL